MIRVFVLIIGIQTQARFLERGSVPTSLPEQAAAYGLNSSPALNVLARQERKPEDTLNGPLEQVYDLLVIRGLS